MHSSGQNIGLQGFGTGISQKLRKYQRFSVQKWPKHSYLQCFVPLQRSCVNLHINARKCWSCLRVLLAGPAAWFACWSCSCTVSSTPAAPKIEPLPAANPHASGMDKLQNCASKLLNVTSETGISIKARKCWSFLLVLLAVSAAWFAC